MVHVAESVVVGQPHMWGVPPIHPLLKRAVHDPAVNKAPCKYDPKSRSLPWNLRVDAFIRQVWCALGGGANAHHQCHEVCRRRLLHAIPQRALPPQNALTDIACQAVL